MDLRPTRGVRAAIVRLGAGENSSASAVADARPPKGFRSLSESIGVHVGTGVSVERQGCSPRISRSSTRSTIASAGCGSLYRFGLTSPHSWLWADFPVTSPGSCRTVRVDCVSRSSRDLSAPATAAAAQLRVDFVSGVSHELRTPLAQIRLFAELLRNGQLRSDAERERSFSIIDEEAQRLTYLVENVLSFARSEHGRSTVIVEPLEMDREMEAAIDAFAPLARVRRAKINREHRAGSRRTRRSASASPDCSQSPRQRREVRACWPDGEGFALVEQTTKSSLRRRQGPGVPKGEREKIWDPYVRLSRETESAAGGSGIGLSIVRELVRLHDGRTWVEDCSGWRCALRHRVSAVSRNEDRRAYDQVQRQSAGVGA